MVSTNIYLIYKHTSPSGKSYIGLTKNLSLRNSRHKIPSSGCVAFASAIKKYKWETFKTKILAENLTLDEANNLEPQFIAEHKTLSPNGYNLCTGGKVGIPADEVRIKISNALRGKKKSEEHKAKLSASHKGKKQTAKHIANARATRVGKKFSEEQKSMWSTIALNMSAEHKAKLSVAAAGRVMSKDLIAKRQETRKRNKLLKDKFT